MACDHFRQAQHLLPYDDRLYGLAAYDTAIGLFYEGAYGEATTGFSQLVSVKNGKSALSGYDRRNCALWLRHAQACANYHEEHAKLGIPEPPRLDPFCGAASLAACLRSLTLPYDKKALVRSCRVTGEGSSLKDIVNAGRNMGLSTRAVTADDQGVMALPKPLVAYVERDHFVALVRADKTGISYLCSDCGPWPGGRVDLTWAQWHALSPGIYVSVTRPGSREDRLLREAIVPIKPAVRHESKVSYAGSLSALRVNINLSRTTLSALRGHVNDYKQFFTFATCGSKPEALHCPGYVHCPTISPSTVSPVAACNGDPVNLATGEEEYTPEPDLVVYNPIGPSITWSRLYNSLRAPVAYPDSNSVDYGVGWSHSYNLKIYAPNGINTSYTGFEPVYLIFPNNSSVLLGDASTHGAQSRPSNFPLTSAIVPFKAVLNGNSVVLTMQDHSRWFFSLSSNAGPVYANLSQIVDRNGHAIYFGYSNTAPSTLTSILDGNGRALLTVNGSQSVSDCYGRTVWYQSGTYGTYSYKELTGVSQVVPTTASAPANLPLRYSYSYADVPNGDGAEVVPFLHTITVPSPIGSGTSTATLWYLNQPNDGVKTNPNYSTASNSGPFVSAIVDSNGATTTITPVSGLNQSQVQVKDGSGTILRTSLYGFDSQMNITLLTDNNKQTTQTRTYVSSAYPYEPSSVTDGNGNTWKFTWDKYGHMLTKTPPSNGVRTPAVTTYTYDTTYFPLGELTSIQTGSKKATTILYDHTQGYGSPLTLSGYVKTVNVSQPGQTGMNNSAYVSLSFVFDGWGNLTSMTTPGNGATYATPGNPSTDRGITTTFGYTTDSAYSQAEAIGQPLTITNNLGKITHLRYDALGRTVGVKDALGNETDFTYTIAGDPLQTILPATGQTGGGHGSSVVSYLYAEAASLATAQWPAGTLLYGPAVATTVYDEGNVGAIRQVISTYGTEGELKQVTGSTEPVSYTYDALYRLKTLTDGGGHTTSYFYNPAGYPAQIVYPGAQATPPVSPLAAGSRDTVSFPTYDGAGNLLSRVDGNNVTTSYVYNDPESLLTDVQYPAGTIGSVHVDYDLYGRRSAMTDGTGSQSYIYDDDDDLTSKTVTYTGQPSQTLSYAFYPDASRQTMVANGRVFAYSYDSVGRMNGVVNDGVTQATYTYQDNGWLSTKTQGNGTVTTFTLDPLGRLRDLANRAAGGTVMSDFAIPATGGYDGVGNRLSVTASIPGASAGYSGTTNYYYDYGNTSPQARRSQLTSVSSTLISGSSGYNYDGGTSSGPGDYSPDINVGASTGVT